MFGRRRSTMVVAALMSAVAGCSSPADSVTPPPPPPPAPLGDLLIDISPVPDVLLPGQRFHLLTYGFDSAGVYVPNVVPDSIIDHYPDVAQLVGDTLIINIKPGHALFTGYARGQYHNFGYDVEQPAVGITILGDSLPVTSVPLVEGGTVDLGTMLAFANDSQARNGRPITWTLSDSALATISTDGDARLTAGTALGTVTVTATREGQSASVPVTIGTSRYVALAAGGNYSCGLQAGGSVWCWGGDTVASRAITYAPYTPAPIPTPVTFASISGGTGHVCGVTPAGAGYCWGHNDGGQLGDGTRALDTVPVAVQGGLAFATIVAGDTMTCGITVDHDGYCWGTGPLGSATASSTTPVAIAGGHKFVQLVSTTQPRFPGGDHSCGLDPSGVAWCWGADNTNQLGDDPPGADNGFGGFSATPVRVQTDSVFTQLALYAGGTSCGLTAGGNVLCWGDIGFPAMPTALTPTQLPGFTRVAQLFGGAWNLCAIKTDSTLICAPAEEAGVFGAVTYRTVAIGAISWQGAKQACAMRTDGITVCWGDNGGGELGTDAVSGTLAPVTVVGQ